MLVWSWLGAVNSATGDDDLERPHEVVHSLTTLYFLRHFVGTLGTKLSFHGGGVDVPLVRQINLVVFTICFIVLM